MLWKREFVLWVCPGLFIWYSTLTVKLKRQQTEMLIWTYIRYCLVSPLLRCVFKKHHLTACWYRCLIHVIVLCMLWLFQRHWPFPTYCFLMLNSVLIFAACPVFCIPVWIRWQPSDCRDLVLNWLVYFRLTKHLIFKRFPDSDHGLDEKVAFEWWRY